MPTIKMFPQCCGVDAICDLGGTAITMGDGWTITERSIVAYIRRWLNSPKNYGKAMLTATTNNQQKTANKALSELGFDHSKWTSKTHHPETKIRLWYASRRQIRKGLKAYDS